MLQKISLYFLVFAVAASINIAAENWIRSSGNNEAHLYSKDIQITQANIENLTKAFIFNTGHTIEALGVQSSPIFIGDKLIINAI